VAAPEPLLPEPHVLGHAATPQEPRQNADTAFPLVGVRYRSPAEARAAADRSGWKMLRSEVRQQLASGKDVEAVHAEAASFAAKRFNLTEERAEAAVRQVVQEIVQGPPTENGDPAATSEEEPPGFTTDDEDRAARVESGFPPDCWLSWETAERWRGLDYPTRPSAEAVRQWIDLASRARKYAVILKHPDTAERLREELLADAGLLDAELGRLLGEAPADPRRVEIEAARKELARFLRRHAAPPPCQLGDNGNDPPDCVISMGERQYRINGSDPLVVTAPEDCVLKAFLGQPAMDEPTLKLKTKIEEAAKVLRALEKGYGKVFAPAIRLAGKKGTGGYHVRIKARIEPA
jgi:hypothetical protein